MQILPLHVLFHTYYFVSKEGIGTARALSKRVIGSDHFTCKCFLRFFLIGFLTYLLEILRFLNAFNQLNVKKSFFFSTD